MRRRSFLRLSSGSAAMFVIGDPLGRRPENPPLLGGIGICRARNENIVKASYGIDQTPLPGRRIPKYVDPLPVFAGQRVSDAEITVAMREFQQQVLPASVYAAQASPYDEGTFLRGYQVGDRPLSSGSRG